MSVNGAPTTERGTAISSPYNWTGLLPWSQFMDDAEKSPDLQWPRSIEWYDQMRNDAQCQGLYLGATAALMRYGWYIDPNECDPFYTDLLAADLNLVVGVDEALAALATGSKSARLRSQGRFGWYRHLGTCLRSMIYGHYYFEQVGDITNDGPGGSQMWRLRKLGPRHPRSITEIKVAEDGGLISISQGYGSGGKPPPEIPVDRLVAYVWDQEPGNWVGRSIYRPMYRNWLIKDRLLRVDAVKHERNGVGMPIIEAPPSATPADIQDLDKMAQEYKVGERGGGAVPYQTKLRLVGTEGSIPDTIGSVRFQNEEMARSMLMMFMQLGQTQTGSRALGQSFIDWFEVQQAYIADWVVATTVQYVIEDWWNWNVDPLAIRTPTLGYVRDEQSQPQPSDFAGAQLPPQMAAELSAPKRRRVGQSISPAASTRRRQLRGEADPAVSTSEMPPVRLPHRKLRRQPYTHEVAAGTDFGALDDTLEAAQADAEAAWQAEKLRLMAQMEGSIRGATSQNVVETISQVGAQAAKEAAAATTGGATSVEGANAAELAFYRVILDTAHHATGQAQSELIKQGLVKAVNYGGVKYWEVGDKGLNMAADNLIGLRSSLTSNTERLTARIKDSYGTVDELAQRVYDEMMARQDVYASDQLQGMISTAVNQSRMDVFTDASEDGELVQMYSSELLDSNTCGNCMDIDGKELSQDEAFELYAGGGYIECEGGPRCRGTVVATYEGTTEPQAPPLSFDEITASEARGDSRPVSASEFQDIAREGQERLDSFQMEASPITELDANWDKLKTHSYTAAQESWGGATIDSHTGKVISPNADVYAMSVKKPGMSTVSIAESASQDDFHAAMDTAKERYSEILTNKQHGLGVFHDDVKKTIDFDPVLVVDNLHDVETIGAATHAIGGAYRFADGNGYWPPHVGA
jgi:hypothetical protein